MAPPILFIHGTFSHGGMFSPWVRYFDAAGYDCHAPSLPGRAPSDPAALRALTMGNNLAAILKVRAELAEPPIVIGHSMGGLLGQQLAAATPCAALVLVASAPPGVLWAQARALPHLAQLLPRILTGRPCRPTARTLNAVVFNDLADEEADRLGEQIVPDSGRVFRSMILGTSRVPRGAVTCPVLCLSGGEDRNVSARQSRATAASYHATHHTFAGRGHWLIAESATSEVAPVVLRWLQEIGLGAAFEPRSPSTA